MCLAAVSGNAKVAGQLIRAGADVNAVDNNGKTALMLAVINGHQSLVELLSLNLDHDLDPTTLTLILTFTLTSTSIFRPCPRF